MRGTQWFLGTAVVILGVSGARARPGGQADEQSRNLIVVVRATFAEGQDTCAGIVFQAQAGRLLVLIANHVVRRGLETPRGIDVQFRWDAGKRAPAQLLATANDGLDLAVLSVPVVAGAHLPRFDRLGDSAAVNTGDPVHTIGHPDGRLWEASGEPGAILRVDGIHLFFEVSPIAPAYAGGALVNDRGELIGMVRSGRGREGEAIKMDRILLWLAANRYSVDLRHPGAPDAVSELVNQIREDVMLGCGNLSVFTGGHLVKGEDVLAQLAAPLAKVEGDARFSNVRSQGIGVLYRCAGGAYLIHSKLEMPERISPALRYLRRSLDYDPAQPLLRQNVAYLEKFQEERRGDTTEYLTNLFQIIDGGNNPQSARLVEQMAGYSRGPEFQAKQWLLKEATVPSIQDFLDDLQLRIEKQSNRDFLVEIESKTLPGGLVEVHAKVGPNSFSWTVDYARRSYVCDDEFTRKIMAVSVKPKP